MKSGKFKDWKKWFIEYATDEENYNCDLDNSIDESLTQRQIDIVNKELKDLNCKARITNCSSYSFVCTTWNPDDLNHKQYRAAYYSYEDSRKD